MTQVEPSAAMRQTAHYLREMYVALVAEGFTVAEAMNVIGVVLASTIARGEPDG